MVPRRCRDHALAALFFGKQQDRIQRTAFLVRRRELMVFELQINICPGKLRQSLAVQRWRRHDGVTDPGMGGTDMFKGQLVRHRKRP